jgi:hypothetical protein
MVCFRSWITSGSPSDLQLAEYPARRRRTRRRESCRARASSLRLPRWCWTLVVVPDAPSYGPPACGVRATCSAFRTRRNASSSAGVMTGRRRRIRLTEPATLSARGIVLASMRSISTNVAAARLRPQSPARARLGHTSRARITGVGGTCASGLLGIGRGLTGRCKAVPRAASRAAWTSSRVLVALQAALHRTHPWRGPTPWCGLPALVTHARSQRPGTGATKP